MPTKIFHSTKAKRKEKRNPGGGRRRKDVGELARALTWYYATRDRMYTRLLGPPPQPTSIDDDPDANRDERLRVAAEHFIIGMKGKVIGGGVDEKIDAALDKLFDFVDGTFRSIRNTGRDPGARWADKGGIRLVDTVAAEDGFTHTAEIYDSPFWELIIPPRPSESRVKQMIPELLDQLGLYRATEEEVDISVDKATDTAPFRAGFNETYIAGIKRLTAGGTINDLALLGALFREAISHRLAHQADFISTWFDLCLMHFLDRNVEDEHAKILVQWLSFYRIFRDRWKPVANRAALAASKVEIERERSLKHHRPPSKKRDSWRVQALALRYAFRPDAHLFPIVSVSPELRAIRTQSQKAHSGLEKDGTSTTS